MYQNTYEIHEIINDSMPFVYHKESNVTKKRNLPNWHENFEILYCISGKGRVHLDSDSVDFNPGDTVIVNSNVIHAVASDSTVIYNCLIVSNDFCRNNGIEIAKHIFHDHIHSEKVRELCLEVFKKIEEYTDDRKYYTLTSVRGALCMLIAELCKNYTLLETDKKKTSTVMEDRIKKVVTYIKDNLASELTLDELSDHVGVSKYHLTRDFKKITSQTIFEFINNYRCKNARHMLYAGFSVSEAAYASGFSNLSYFTRKFKKITGKLPSEYVTKSKENKKEG